MKRMKPQAMMMTKMTMNNPQHRAPQHLFSRIVTATAAVALLFALPSFAQKKEPTVRLIQGTVTDKSDKPISGAVVYLKDEKTLTVKSFLTDEQGHYRFGQLSMSNDYEIWADQAGTHSKSKHLSSFNSKPTVDYSFQIDK